MSTWEPAGSEMAPCGVVVKLRSTRYVNAPPDGLRTVTVAHDDHRTTATRSTPSGHQARPFGQRGGAIPRGDERIQPGVNIRNSDVLGRAHGALGHPLAKPGTEECVGDE